MFSIYHFLPTFYIYFSQRLWLFLIPLHSFAKQHRRPCAFTYAFLKSWLISIMAIAIKKKLKAGISEFCSSHPT